MSDLATFLTNIDPTFDKYAEQLKEEGLESVEELKEVSTSEMKDMGIKMFHAKRIKKAIDAKYAPAQAANAVGQDEEKDTLGAPSEGFSALDDRRYSKAQESTKAATATSSLDNTVRQRLVNFYKVYNPERVNDKEGIDQLLKKYQGKTNQLFIDLERKYMMGLNASSSKRKKFTRKITKTTIVTQGLVNIYMKNIRSLEETYQFPQFYTPLLNPIDFDAKPIVMLVGQYSVGKTSFIKFLLERDFPGIRIGPEPTTDCFAAIMHGLEERLIPGNAAVMDSSKPFKTLTRFGMGFMNKFTVAEVPAPILESITFVDTPGILSGEKQRIGRNYDFPKIVEWFAYKADRILLLFDAHKLDISDELRMALECIKGHDDKVRIVLNKADTVSNQQLLRVYGALMWSLGKVFKTPEVLRVFVGSFWDKPYADDHNAELFDAEANDLLSDLKGLPRHSATRKINEFVKRTRRLKVHLLILGKLRDQLGFFGKKKSQNKALANLGQIFRGLAEENNLNLNDFPPPNKFRKKVEQFDISKFPKVKKQDIQKLNSILENDVPKLMADIPSLAGGDDEGAVPASNPFGQLASENDATIRGAKAWVVDETKKNAYDNEFYKLELSSGKASGAQVMNAMLTSGLTRDTLKAIWELSDIDRDGKMDSEEFATCMFLIDHVKGGLKLPATLPMQMVPPGKRKLLEFS